MNFRVFLYSILGFALIIMSVFAWSTYSYYEAIHSDDPIPPSLTVTLGTSKIIRGDLAYDLTQDEFFVLENKDIIETAEESRANIIWPDKSITRLGPKTRIVIEKMYASIGYEAIEITYTMERGKVWNTVIRSLIGDSYFQVHLPRESIVAGVRGTTFEVNLDNKYIHAVDHNTLVSQGSKGSVEIMPGELVDTENILIKKGREWLDTTWNEWNKSADFLYESLRKLELNTRLEKLTEGIGEVSVSNMTRTVLDKISGFEDLKIAEYLDQKIPIDTTILSPSSLVSYYQKLGNFSDIPSKEILRNSLLGSGSPIIANIRDSLQMHAFWESVDTGKLSETTEKYLLEKGINMTEFKSRFTEGAKNDVKELLQTFSGGIRTLFPF